jgi:hypothetical protein
MPGRVTIINPADQVGWKPREWSAAARVCPATTAALIRDKKVKSVKLGKARIILTPPAEFLASLVEADQPGAGA